MDILGVPLWLLFLTVIMASLVWYSWHMSKDLNVFEKLGISGPPPFPIVGSLGFRYWVDGMFKSQIKLYRQYQDRKFYGVFEANTPVLHIKDCDMIQDVLVTHFEHFSDRPNRFKGDPLMDKCTHFLKGEKWKNTREIISSALNPKFLQYSTFVIQRSSDSLMNFLKPKIDWRRNVELSSLAFFYSADVHSGIVFSGNYKTFSYLNGKHVANLERLSKQSRRWRLSSVFFPFLSTILRICRISVVPKSALKHFNNQVDNTLQKYETGAKDPRSNQCLLGAMTTSLLESRRFMDNNGNNNSDSMKNERSEIIELSTLEIKAQAFTFMHSGLEKVSSILSLVLFQLANNTSICEQVQREIDQHIGTVKPNEKNVQNLVYLDQCINETIRMFPPYLTIDRICTEEITIQGIRIPKNMTIRIPVYALHHDPSIWKNPEEYRPERFNPIRSAARHQSAFLPFGMGPRSCLGMRMALLELKIVIVSMLRVLTLIPCAKTDYPVWIQKWKVAPETGNLWVKVRPRFWLGVCEYPSSTVLS